MARKGLTYVVSILVVLGAASTAVAEDAPPAAPPPAAPVAPPDAPLPGGFGARRLLVLSSDLGLDFGYSSIESKSRVNVSLAADLFVLQNVSAGLVLGYQQGDTSTSASSSWRVGARAGYNLAFHGGVSLWPRVGVELRGAEVQTTSRNSSDTTALAVVGFVPVLIFPAPGFFVGFGPYVSQDVWVSPSGSEKLLDLGARFVLGGFFGI